MPNTTQRAKVVYLDTYRDGCSIMIVLDPHDRVPAKHIDCVARRSFKFGGYFHRKYLTTVNIPMVAHNASPVA